MNNDEGFMILPGMEVKLLEIVLSLRVRLFLEGILGHSSFMSVSRYFRTDICSNLN